MEMTDSFNNSPKPAVDETTSSWKSDFGFNDRRYSLARQTSFQESLHTPISIVQSDLSRPFLSMTASSIDMPNVMDEKEKVYGKSGEGKRESFIPLFGFLDLRSLRSGSKPMKKLFSMISFNVAYSTVELLLGLVTGRIGHYLVVSAVANLLVNLVGVWFFRNYARVTILYKKPEDINQHAVCLHVLADSVRSAGLILASWLLSLGVENAEVLCLGLVSVTVFMLAMPLFKTSGGILLQMSPSSIPPSALSKCLRQINSHEDVAEVTQSRFWEFLPGHVVGSLSVQVKAGVDDRPVLHFVHNMYHELGVQELTVEIEQTPRIS